MKLASCRKELQRLSRDFVFQAHAHSRKNVINAIYPADHALFRCIEAIKVSFLAVFFLKFGDLKFRVEPLREKYLADGDSLFELKKLD